MLPPGALPRPVAGTGGCPHLTRSWKSTVAPCSSSFSRISMCPSSEARCSAVRWNCPGAAPPSPGSPSTFPTPRAASPACTRRLQTPAQHPGAQAALPGTEQLCRVRKGQTDRSIASPAGASSLRPAPRRCPWGAQHGLGAPPHRRCPGSRRQPGTSRRGGAGPARPPAGTSPAPPRHPAGQGDMGLLHPRTPPGGCCPDPQAPLGSGSTPAPYKVLGLRLGRRLRRGGPLLPPAPALLAQLDEVLDAAHVDDLAPQVHRAPPHPLLALHQGGSEVSAWIPASWCLAISGLLPPTLDPAPGSP